MIEQEKTSPLENIVPQITEVTSFNPRETGSRTVIEERNGKKKEKSEPIFKPFTAKLQISKQTPLNQLKELGISHRPSEDVHIHLSERDGKLYAKINSSYRTTETRQVEQHYNHTFTPAGTEIAPYCYSQKDEWDYETRYISQSYPVTKTEGLSEKLSKESSAVLCAAIIQAAKERGAGTAKKLVAFLNSNFKKDMTAGRTRLRKSAEAEIEKLKTQADAIGAQLKKLNMPSIGRAQ